MVVDPSGDLAYISLGAQSYCSYNFQMASLINNQNRIKKKATKASAIITE